MVLIKKIKTPQDIFILSDITIRGNITIRGMKSIFLIDDDECSFEIASGKKILGLGSFGICLILTKEELVANRDKINMDYYEDIFGDNSILIENFVGDINLKVIVDGDDVITEENYDRDEFIYHQKFSNYIQDIIVDIGEGYQFKQFEMSETILNAICREEKIDSIFRD